MNTLDDNESALHAANAALSRRRAMKRLIDEMDPALPQDLMDDYRRALRRGDQGSPECVTFAPLPECRDCSDPLYDDSRSPVHGMCRYCLEESLRPKPTPRRKLVLIAVVAGVAVAAAINALAWAIGGMLP